MFSKTPDVREVGARLGRLARRVFKGARVDVSPTKVTAKLHRYASPVRISVLPDGEIEIHATTSRLGAAYHREVMARIAPILDELDYVLEGDDGDPEADMLAWLASELEDGATRIGMPADRTFKLDAAVQTAMGPRDEAWRDAVIADPTRGTDAFAWWTAGPGRAELASALLAMWLDVPWREPLDNAERDLMDRVDEDLTAAMRANPDLPLPWADWSEMLEWLGRDDEHAHHVRDSIGKTPVPEMRIGYRRHLIEVELNGGWSFDLGGGFVGRWEDDGAQWWATDGDRVVEFTSLTADGELDSQKLLEVAPALHPVIGQIAEGEYRGRAEAYDEDDVHVVHGLVTRAPHVAILTCKGRPSDEEWALATWRSLRND